MTCGCNDKCELPKALQINNPGEVTLFHRVDIPASQGDDETYPPKNGLYRNVLLVYLANNHSYLYNSDGIPTRVDGPAGPGTAAGGETGQVLAKRSDADYDTTWVTQTSANDAKLTLTRNNTEIGDFTANASVDKTIDIEVPTKTSDLENDGATGDSTYVETTALADYYTKDETNAAIGIETTAREGADQNLQQQIDAITVASDVVDVVGTYADLQAYDTSKLSDNDIIKVLADESKNGATTYYRWIKNSSSWTYIGSEGPYYTKSESDSTFQGKLTAGANITIDANNEISATDTTYTAGEGVEINGTTINAKVRRVYDYYTSRPASANTTATGNGGMFTFQATSNMTTGKPKNDASILQLEWDNNAGHDTQLAMTPGVHGSWLAHRHQNSGTWGSWIYVLDDVAGSVKTANIDALAVTTAKIADGAITEAKMDATAWAKKVNVASIDLTGETTTLLSLAKTLGTNGIHYARWMSRTDGGSSGISDKPTGNTNASFVCEARCSRWAANVDYRYQLMCWVQQDTNPYVAYVSDTSSSISWSRLRPTVNNATLTVTQNGTSAGTFTANSATDTTIALTDTTYSDFTGATSSVAGAHGLVPAPTTSDPDKFLKGDGTWGTPPGTTYTEGTGIDITGSTIAVDTTQVSMKTESAVKKSYTIDLTAQSTSNFYPVIFPRTNNMIDCEIHSQGGGSGEPYNQNIIHFNVISEGWSDNYVTKKLIILQEGNYSNSEITIGCIGLGHQDGYNCVWLRGGIMYYFTSNFVAEAHTSDYQINNEKFTVGPNYYGGTNANVDIYRTPLNTSKDVALLEDVDARANLYRYTKSQYNSSSNSWYYPIANLPIDNSNNSASVIINGRFGGWTNANMAKIDLLLTNRSDYSGNNVTASGSIKGPYTGALAMCNVVVYKQTDKSAIVYLKCDSYFAFDITADYYQATKSWTGNYTTTPSGTLIWSTATTNALEKVDQNGRISKVREIYDHFTSRPTNANLTATGNGGMFTFQATGSMTTAKPKSDSHILQLEWDNTSGYDSQLAVSNTGNNPWVGIRAQQAGTWSDWTYLLNDTAGSVKTANIDALAVTTAKIADGAVTEAKINATDWAKKVNVAGDDLTGQTADLLALTKALGTAGTDYKRWICKYDGATANISNKPVAESFVCEAFCTRWTSSSDYRYQLMMRAKADTNPYVAHVDNNSASITWERLRPVVNDATLTLTQGGSTLGTFTANASSNVTIDVPTSTGPKGDPGKGCPIGTILPYTSSTMPEGYLLCDGSAVSRTTYADLFDVIGTTYGTGDGSTTFNLPNLKGKVPVGQDTSDTSFDALGETGGEKTHTLTVSEMPKHQHRISSQKGTPGNSSWDYGQPGNSWSASSWNPNPTEPIGGNGAHNNLQPYIVLNYIIKFKDLAATVAEVKDQYTSSATDVYSANYINTSLFDLIYPVGSIYMSATMSTTSQVQAAFGGTWVAWGAGRVPVGVDTSDTSFDTVEETGGEKTHTLVNNELPKIDAYWQFHGTEHGTNVYNLKGSNSIGTRINGKYQAISGASGAYSYSDVGIRFGNNEAHNNLQPYITCYMYKRTA